MILFYFGKHILLTLQTDENFLYKYLIYFPNGYQRNLYRASHSVRDAV